MNCKAKDYLIVALDTSSKDEALKVVQELKDCVGFFKVGLELFTACGPKIIQEIKKRNCKIFFDGKFLDIPNTVSKAIANLVCHKVDMINVHLSGGIKMLLEAKEILQKTAKENNIQAPKLLGVTVLTSITNEILQDDLQIKTQIEEYVLSRAKLAMQTGLDGIVCSPREASVIRKATSEDFLIVTPGVRPLWSTADDQMRIATPKEAITSGTNYIVVGRPITQAKDPLEATKKILEEIESCC
ncbi:MAG: orotidine-5'-phosphate decarboxylase [Candidatus Melainabacteria bacterium]|nr:orotidine-5'-phosphate decarboxylase [Candidatus Melainabacteria bacterium]